MKQAYLECGKIINTHGIRGDLKLDLWCDSPDTVKKIKTLYLDDLCVDEACRGKHVGKALYERVLAFAKERDTQAGSLSEPMMMATFFILVLPQK